MGSEFPEPPHYDVIVIGTGVSGIDAAYRLQSAFPRISYAILESRDTLGGTWSFWKYPGFRSDSYMSGYAFPWYKWPEVKGIADGDVIYRYVKNAARSQGIDKKILYSHRVVSADWSNEDVRWRLKITRPQGPTTLYASFVFNCAGYYDYETPFESPIPGIETFKGTIAVPQFWPQDLDFSGKKIVLIGSGATAITLLPTLAQTAGQLTMLQRSPSYVFSVSATRLIDRVSSWLLPKSAAQFISYWSMLFTEFLFLGLLLNFPGVGRWVITKLMAKQLPADIPVEKHFNPSYSPFQQRLGMCPDGDFFKALKQPNVDIVTDVIETVTPTGIRTKDGTFIKADIIIPATGLKLNPGGGIPLTVSANTVKLDGKFMWRGCMVEGIPNMGFILGYFTNSWTPGADIGVQQLIRVMKQMRKTGSTIVTPSLGMGPAERDEFKSRSKPFFDTNATYIVAALGKIPRVARSGVWTGRRNWVFDWLGDRFYGVEKGLEYTNSTGAITKEKDA